MAKTWHYSEDGADTQTVDEKTFAERCRTGKISDGTMVWTPGMERWQSYAELRADEEAAEIVRRAAQLKAAGTQAEDDAARYTCAKCNKEWPEAFTVKAGVRRLCRLCHSKEQEAARLAAEFKANSKTSWWLDTRVIVTAIVVFVGAVGTLVYACVWGKGVWNAPPTQAAEAWAGKPRDQWPLLTLSGDVSLRGWPQPVHAANTCLVADPQGHVLGIGFTDLFQAAAHTSLAGAATTVANKPVPAEQLLRSLGASLAEWRVGAKDPHPLVFTKVHGLPADYGKSEVVLLDPAAPLAPSGSLPGTALHVRTTSVQKDMRVFVVGGTPATPGEKQHVVQGNLHATFNNQKTLDLAMNAPVDPAALIGAPVIDDGGHLVGIVNGTLDNADKNGHITSLSAEGLLSFAKPLGLPPPGPKAAH